MNVEKFLDMMAQLPTDKQDLVMGMLKILTGKIPEDPLVILHLNRHAILMQRNGEKLPIGTMPLLAGLALNIIDGVADLADRRVLMSYFWHVEDVQQDKVPGALERAGVCGHV